MKKICNKHILRFRHYAVGLLAEAKFYKDLTVAPLFFQGSVFDKSLV